MLPRPQVRSLLAQRWEDRAVICLSVCLSAELSDLPQSSLFSLPPKCLLLANLRSDVVTASRPLS